MWLQIKEEKKGGNQQDNRPWRLEHVNNEEVWKSNMFSFKELCSAGNI